MNALEWDEWTTCKHQAVTISQELAAAIEQAAINPALCGIYLAKAQRRASDLYRRMEDWPHIGGESEMKKAGAKSKKRTGAA